MSKKGKEKASMEDKSEIKIFILYLVDRIGYPVKFTDICSILYQENVASYFDGGDCFTALVDAGHLIEIKQTGENGEEAESLYIVSPTGKKIAEELSDTLLSSVRESSYRSAIRHLSFQKRGATTDCNATPTENGKYMVHCEIAEHGKKVLDINIEVDTKIEADRMLRNFSKRPEIVYRGMLALVSGETNYIFE